MKKILFILPSLIVGGLERVLVTIANELAKKNYDITVVTLSPGDDMKDELDSRVRFVYKPPKQLLGNRIPYIRRKYYDDGMWETRASAETLYKYYVGNERYDIEIAFFRGLSVKIVSGSTNKSAVHIAWVHNDFKKAYGYCNNFKSILHVRNAYQSMDHVVCVSKQAQEGFKEVIGDTGNLTTVYNPLPIKQICERADLSPAVYMYHGKLHIVSVGRLEDYQKGQKRLTEIVVRLHNEGADISLAFVGGGRDEKMLRELIKTHNAGGYITLTGGQKNPYPYIKEADLLVCSSFFEGYNLTVAEALILGVPVLSTDCSGPNELLDHGKYGMIVENSEKGLYNGLRQFVEKPELLNEYKEKALQRQGFFDEEKIIKQITDLF